MPGIIQTALPDAERVIFDWLIALFNATEDTDAFKGKLPKSLDLEQSRVFAFMLSGGNVMLNSDVNFDEPGGCGEWERNGYIRGVFTSEALAYAFDGELRAALPITSTMLDGVTRFYTTQESSITPTTFLLKEDQTTGGEVADVWAFELSVISVFTIQP